MKKQFVLFAILLAMGVSSQAQVFNTGSTLRPRQFSVGLNPVFWDSDLGFFFHGGYGLKTGIDFGVHFGVLNYGNYFGADLEWQFMSGKPAMSLSTGGHVIGETFGLDLAANLSIPIRSDVDIYTGFDTDFLFTEPETIFWGWIPVGLELALQRRMTMMLEGEISVTDAPSIFGGGIAFYF